MVADEFWPLSFLRGRLLILIVFNIVLSTEYCRLYLRCLDPCHHVYFSNKANEQSNEGAGRNIISSGFRPVKSGFTSFFPPHSSAQRATKGEKIVVEVALKIINQKNMIDRKLMTSFR